MFSYYAHAQFEFLPNRARETDANARDAHSSRPTATYWSVNRCSDFFAMILIPFVFLLGFFRRAVGRRRQIHPIPKERGDDNSPEDGVSIGNVRLLWSLKACPIIVII